MSDAATLYWNLEGSGPIDPSNPFSLGSLASPGSLTPVELSFYYESSLALTNLLACGFYISPYDHIYPQPLISNAISDWRELRSWGILQGQTPTGLQINLDKENDYPDNSWQTFSTQVGSTMFNKIPLIKEAVSLGGGVFASVDQELPLAGKVYFKLRLNSPGNASHAGLRYFNLIFDYSY